MVEISAGRLHLRPFRPTDAAAVFAACQDAEIQRWTTVPSPYREEDARSFVEEFVPAGWSRGTAATFAIVDSTDGALLGNVSVNKLDAAWGLAEVGYWAAAQARGKGVMTQALGAVCRWAFAECGRERIEWLAGIGNVASRRVAEKAGFTIEGVLRSRIVLNGERVDTWIGSLLRGDVAG